MIKLPDFDRLPIKLISASLAILVTALVTYAQVPPPPNPQTEPPRFSVKGRVVYDNTDRPVRRSPVSLVQFSERGGGGELSSATDRAGRFVIENVPAGIYFVMVNSPGIITPLAFMSLTDKGPPETLNLKAIKEYCTEVVVDGGDVETTVHARRGGAISGKVTYSDGEPAINAEVAVIRRAGGETTRVISGFNASALLSLHTDDRGRFRIAGLPPGEYIVSASEKNTSPNRRNGRGMGFDELFGSSDALIVTYYGDTSNIRDALKLEVAANSELSDININLADSTPHTISGSVIAKLDRIALPGATVSIRLKDQVEWFGREFQGVQTDDQGQWSLDGVPDGTYSIRVEPPDNIPVTGARPTPANEEMGIPERLPTRGFVKTETMITVTGGDLLVEPIALAEGASISGTVEMPESLKEPGASGFIQIVWRYEGEVSGGYRNQTGVYGGGEFSIAGLREGKVFLSANVGFGGPAAVGSPDYYVKSITLNGADLTVKPVTLREGQSITGVRLVVAEGLAKASVKLIDAEGKPVAAQRVAIVPVDSSRWSFSREIVNGITDSRGIMSFTCAPREYLVIVAATEDSWPPTPRVIEQHSSRASRLKITSGDNAPVIITIAR